MVSCDLLDVIRLSWAAHQCAATHKVADIDRAWEHLQCAVACRVAAGHQCVLLGDFMHALGVQVLMRTTGDGLGTRKAPTQRASTCSSC
jgi:hypothetical protein